jgi:hypothetical protein
LENLGNGLVEGYATVQEIIEIPLADISNYERNHVATKWLLECYGNKQILYGYCLKQIKKETKLFFYPENSSIWFTLN